MLNAILEKLENYKNVVLSSCSEISDLDITSKSLIERYLQNTECLESLGVVKIQAVIDYMHEQVNIGNWREVPIYLRKTITIASYVYVLTHFKCSGKISDDIIRESFKIIDFGILFGCPINKEPLLLQKCATAINSVNVNNVPLKNYNNISNKISLDTDINVLNYTPLNVLDCPSMENFYKNHILSNMPVVIDNCMRNWPALEKWSDPQYFIRMAGLRTVSIELGNKYTDSNWTQKLMTIEEFINSYIYESNGPVGYLAQYQLFEQIPELKNDIVEPEYCCFADNDEPTDVMAWFGPTGTVSPLHHDPKKNLLTQVVGRKQIFLISPGDSDLLYPHEHELLCNTARVDPRHPDFIKYPNFKKAKVYQCILKEGQMLYIPPKWWHFVESLSVSFSVSFWWD